MKLMVSAIITTRNRSHLLRKAIESVLSQTYKELECIVVDDSSTDDTRQVCSEYPIQYIYIPKEESRGGNYARNLGIKASQGDLCAFLDDDDSWLPNKIEKQVNLLNKKKCECVYCLRIYEIVVDGKVISENYENTRHAIEGDISKKVFRHSFTSTSCILVTKSILNEIGGFDEQLFKIQEYELLVRISQLTQIFYCHDEPLVRYTVNVSDKARISNDPTRLPIAKKYVESKHKVLLRKAGLYNRLLHYDWMYTALYHSAVKSQNKKLLFKYSIYYYLKCPIIIIRYCAKKISKVIKYRVLWIQ